VFLPFDPTARVHLGVVSLGTPVRLVECLEALRTHEARHDFVVSVCVNPDTMTPGPLDRDLPEGIRVERPAANLGWGAGLHRLRALVDSEYLVWVQDDMVPEPGWLDALVDAADTYPAVGVFGALRVGDDGAVMLYNGGLARPPGSVDGWNETDTTVEATPSEVTLLEWVTSKGCLTRTEVFDAVGGPDPRLWPLNHVDKDFSTHARCHGWDLALVPSSRLRHAVSQSSPISFREFLTGWRDDWFDRRWAGPATALSGQTSGVVEHPCAEWREERPDLVEALSGREATKMLVPFARARASAEDRREQELLARIAELETAIAERDVEIADLHERRRRLRRRIAKLKARVERMPE